MSDGKIIYVILVHSKYSEKSVSLIRYIKENQYNYITLLSVDSKEARYKILSDDNLNVKMVPTLLIVYENGTLLSYEGYDKIKQWLDDVAKKVTSNKVNNMNNTNKINKIDRVSKIEEIESSIQEDSIIKEDIQFPTGTTIRSGIKRDKEEVSDLATRIKESRKDVKEFNEPSVKEFNEPSVKEFNEPSVKEREDGTVVNGIENDSNEMNGKYSSYDDYSNIIDIPKTSKSGKDSNVVDLAEQMRAERGISE